jgi:hypothetical protein
LLLCRYDIKGLTNRTTPVSVYIMADATHKGQHVAHKDLKPSMQILTTRGWATVFTAPIPSGTMFLVRLTNGRCEIRDPGYLWIRRTTYPLPTKETT